jgi:diacylglycerol kinase (ATP)
MSTKNSFLTRRIKSIGYACKGVIRLIKTEANAQVQVFFAIFATIAGFYFDISKTEWGFQIFCIGLVISLEAINTSIENLLDFIHPEQHKTIGKIKDISAGAVLIAATTALCIGLIIYIPKIVIG